jgi:hypothetical protein
MAPMAAFLNMLVILSLLDVPRRGLQGKVPGALAIFTCILMPELPMNGKAAYWFEAMDIADEIVIPPA